MIKKHNYVCVRNQTLAGWQCIGTAGMLEVVWQETDWHIFCLFDGRHKHTPRQLL